jgi:hydrogenase-4 component F
MALFLIVIPFLCAAAALVVRSNRARPWLLPAAAVMHLAGTIALLVRGESDAWSGHMWLAPDPPGKLVLLLLSSLFMVCAWYAVGYLRQRQERTNGVFCACVLSFLGATTLVACSEHLGIMWVAIEATTLATAPLIYFNRTPRSIEATWKYLLVGSVGIALALLGTFFLAYSAVGRAARGAEMAASAPAPATLPATASATAPATESARVMEPSLLMADLIAQAPGLSRPWLLAAFVMLLVGYGTKMGLAPMHMWKPDAYGEAPGMVGALLAGGLTSCAFLILMRVQHVCVLAGEARM